MAFPLGDGQQALRAGIPDMENRAAGPHPLLRNLDGLFEPASIAFIGATDFSLKWGFLVFNNLLAGGFQGDIYPVNPGRESVMGLKSYGSVRDIPGRVDLAVFTVPAAQVPGVMDDCAAKGVRAALVISAGFKEQGAAGAELEREMVRRARAGGMVLAGPNGQGICNPGRDLFPWMPLFFPPPGRVAFLSQSGNVLNMLVSAAYKAGSGVSKAVSIGNEADLRVEDYLLYLADDPDTEVIVVYVEGTQDGRRFFDLAGRVTPRKPVIVMKGGTTGSGIAAARSHTGAVAVSSDLFDASCEQAGIIRARSIEEAGVLAASFVDRPLPRGRRVGIVTGGGGLGVITSDLCTREGLEVAKLSPETLDAVGRHLPAWWVPGNPVDLVAGLDFQVTLPIIETMMLSGEVDAVIFTFVAALREPELRMPSERSRGMDLREMWDKVSEEFVSRVPELYGPMREKRIPLYLISNLIRSRSDAGRRAAADGNGVTAYDDLEMACRALAEMARYRAWRDGTPGD